MTRLRLVLLAAPLVLAACGGGGGGGVQAPAAVQGTWGADCGSPFVTFQGGKVTVVPDHATYDLKSADLAGNQLTVAYATPQGAVSEVYVLEGSTLRLDHGTYAGTEATWHKAPMQKCG
jgi:hypothetical protein